MAKFSVKKPITVFVCVIVIIALGIVSLLGMTPDLIPDIDLPYIVVMTTYPGATPKEVETSVTKPLEQSLATVENLKSIQSVSSANYSLIILEFENGSSMDTAIVNTLQFTDLASGSFDDSVGDPYILKINPSMIPITVAAVSQEGKTTEELSAFVEGTLMNKLEGTTGVASISSAGLIESQINVVINEKKIDKVNTKLVNYINSEMADARVQINDGLTAIKNAESELLTNEAALKEQKEATYDQLTTTMAQVDSSLAKANAALNSASSITQEQTQAMVTQLEEGYKQAERGAIDAQEQFRIAEEQIANAKEELASQKKKLQNAKSSLDSKANEALKQADLTEMVTLDMVSGILQGQNFNMPAGYIQENGEKYLVSVGDKLTDVDDVKDLYLFKLDGVGDVRLSDVCDVFVKDNSEEVYGSVDGEPGVLLTFSKQSNYATAQVSENIKDKFAELEDKYEGLKFTTLMDQGDYIYLIIKAILESLLYGALFAVLILLLFLRDLKPTFITLLSIPISLTFAIALMYFTGVSINMISLSGLAISVGMLVDNAIVVIENTFRLRREGVPPKKAAVAGAKQVAGAITSSTLTTVCVFFPIVFTHGITRQLFTDLALTVLYSLMASLLIALTLVPAMSSFMFKKDVKPEGRAFDGFKNLYRKLLGWNLRHKFIILAIAILLLAYSVVATLSKGLTFIPSMSTPQQAGTITITDEKATLEETKEISNKVIETLSNVEGVDTVGGMLASSGSMSSLTGETDTKSVSLYLILDQDNDLSTDEIADNCEEACKNIKGCEVEILSTSSITSYTSALGGSGVTVNVFCTDQDKLNAAALSVAEVLEGVAGIATVDNGLQDADPEYHFVVNKDKAMKKGLTVAQVYMAIQSELTYEKDATTLISDDKDYDIVVSTGDEESVTLKDLKNIEVEGTKGTVKVKDVCKIEKTESLPSVNRLDQNTYISVSGELEEGYNITLVTDAAKEALDKATLPNGVRYEFNGENEMIVDAMKDLVLMMLLAILLVYLIMVAQFQSMRSPLIVMFTIPLAFTGGLLALLITGKEVSIIAMIGLIMLVGIIVNNGIVLVDYTNQLRAMGLRKKEAIIEAGATRMRPVLMTSLTTILGLVIMAVGKTAGTDMMQPLALTCIGGLFYATALTLFVVPVMYDILNGEEYKHTTKEDLDISDLMVE